MDDRRKSNRIDAHDEGLRVSNAIDGEHIGIVGNLSDGGAMLIAGRELHAGGILQLNLEAPASLGGGIIPVGVKVLWCTPAHSPNEFWAGLETVDISAASAQALRRLLGQLSGSS